MKDEGIKRPKNQKQNRKNENQKKPKQQKTGKRKQDN